MEKILSSSSREDTFCSFFLKEYITVVRYSELHALEEATSSTQLVSFLYFTLDDITSWKYVNWRAHSLVPAFSTSSELASP